MAVKLLNAVMLFKYSVFNKTAAMGNVGDVFASDIHYSVAGYRPIVSV